ncbi:glycosyltransferase [Sorangium sp. So ce1036]|uniref:glycosyltransferase family 2 protein n=1 Tax=Sorangium sp. So ce1036 TaxID=3133328 RepID=UPI003F0EDA4F
MTLFPFAVILLIVFMNRYVGGVFWKRIRGSEFDATRSDYEPTVTVVIPLFNEGEGVYHTVLSVLAQDYPPEKLNVTVVDDCSKDGSYEWACKAAATCPSRVAVIRNPHNMGKRKGINRAVRKASSEIIVSVDSDVIVDSQAVRRLVARFVRDEIAAVGGRVIASNANDNWLTRMQAIKYFFGYEYLKNLERAFASVMCLSGCLTAYRRHVLLELEPILERRNVLGIAIKYGEDRFLTRQIVKAGYQTVLTLDAVCWTVVPTTLTKYFSQQLRWRRSNLIDFCCGLSHAWRLHPVIGLHYLSQFAMLVLYPVAIVEMVTAWRFWELAAFHVAVLAVFGAIYWQGTRELPESMRVHPGWFLSMSFVMPVTYLLFTPLALFTLDSSSWETRGHAPAPDVPLEEAEPAKGAEPPKPALVEKTAA